MSATHDEAAVVRWHRAVNRCDLTDARAAVTDPIVVNGPRGAGPITVDAFVGWIEQSGITLRPVAFHLIGERVIVVDQVARRPEADDTRVATFFRITDGRISAALRFPDLDAALDFAELHVALTATDSSPTRPAPPERGFLE